MTKRPLVRIRDISCKRGLVGGPFGSSLVKTDYVLGGIPVIRGQNLSNGRWVDFENCVFVSEEKVTKDLARNMAQPDDIVFTQRGTLGQVAIVPPGLTTQAVISQSQMRLRVDEDIADCLYIYYCASSPAFLENLTTRAIVAGVPHINLGILGDLEIPLPTLVEQRRIARVLGALDDLIETNKRLMSFLDQLGMALFRQSWDGHSTVAIGKLGEITMGQSPPGSTYNEDSIGMVFFQGVRDFGDRYPQSRVFCNEPSRIANQGDILIAVRAPVGETNIATEETAIGRGLAALKAKQPSLALRALRETESTWAPHQGTGTVFSSITGPDLRRALVPEVANAEVERILDLLDAQHRASAEEVKSLSSTRDELLPLLLSGAVTVAEVAV